MSAAIPGGRPPPIAALMAGLSGIDVISKIPNTCHHTNCRLRICTIDRLPAAVAGVQAIDADQAYKDQAAKNLGRWLSEADFAADKPQIEWLIDERKWASLLDCFYLIMPFGTGGRRGLVGVGPNRVNL